MCLILTSGPATAAQIAESTANALEENESQAMLVLAVIAGLIVIGAIIALVFRMSRKKNPARS